MDDHPRPNGRDWLDLAEKFLGQRSIRTVIEPTLADTELECSEALASGRYGRAKLVQFLGLLVLTQVVFALFVQKVRSRISVAFRA